MEDVKVFDKIEDMTDDEKERIIDSGMFEDEESLKDFLDNGGQVGVF